MSEDPLLYLVSDYSATGEGRTVSTLITAAFPLSHDYATQPSWNSETYNEGTLKNTTEERARREFTELFGEWFATGVEVMDRYEFFHKCGSYVPEYAYKMTDPDSDGPYFHYFSQVHFNYS